MEIRLAQYSDLPRLLDLVRQAQLRMAAASIDQWQDGYPNEAVLREDIELGEGRVLTVNAHDGQVLIMAYFVVCAEGEPDYLLIEDGAWLTEGTPYLTLHRLMVAEEALRQGVAAFIYAALKEEARRLAFASIRADTHRDNLPMRHSLSAAGFVRCGVIYITQHALHEAGKPREAYEYLVN